MKAKTDPRHVARKLALCSVFCWLFYDPDHEECMRLSSNLLGLEPGDADLDLTNKIVEGVTNNLKAIDSIIQKAAPEWPIDKISKIDLVVLRIAIFEIVFGKSVPEKVAITEMDPSKITLEFFFEDDLKKREMELILKSS